MIRRHAQPGTHTDARFRRSQKARLHRLFFESLEDRTMLDSGGLPAAIVIGRTLATPSTAAHGDAVAVVLRGRGPEQPGHDHVHRLQRAGRPGDRRAC